MSGTQAQVIPAQQPIGGGITASPLAAAIMGRMGAGLPQGQMSNPLSGIPLWSLAQMMQQGWGALSGNGNNQWGSQPAQPGAYDLPPPNNAPGMAANQSFLQALPISQNPDTYGMGINQLNPAYNLSPAGGLT